MDGASLPVTFAPVKTTHAKGGPLFCAPLRGRGSDSDWRLQPFAIDAWKTLYRFDLQPQFPADYRISNWWTSTNPDSHFVTGLSVALAPAGRRLALRNRQFSKHTTRGATTKRTLASAAENRAVLQDEFLVRLPINRKLDDMLDRLPA